MGIPSAFELQSSRVAQICNHLPQFVDWSRSEPLNWQGFGYASPEMEQMALDPRLPGRFQPIGCQPRISRRQMLQVGGLGLMGVSLPKLLAAQEVSQLAAKSRADACIILFLDGGPSH